MTYRVGISGLGRGIGPGRVFNLMPDCKVVGGYDPDEAARKRVQEMFPDVCVFDSYEDMLAQGLDIVVVASPIPAHRDQTVAALEAGCHVLQEVTLAWTIAECRDILEAVKAHPKQKFMMGENCCYWAHIMAWRELWKRGELGEFMYAEAEYIHDIRGLLRKPDGSPTWRASRPPILYCSHSLGPLLYVTGERCVTACGMHTGSKLEPDLNHLDFEVGIFQTSSGGVIKITKAQGVVREPMFHYYSIYGTKGCLETSRPPEPLRTNAYFDDVPHLQNMVQMPLNENVPEAPREARIGGHGTAEYYMIEDFLDSIRNDTRPPIDIYAALDMSLPGLCAHESALQGGAPVPIPDWRE